MERGFIKIWIIVILLGSTSLAFGLDDEEKSAIKAIKAGDILLLKSYLKEHPGLNCEFSNGKTGLYYAIASDKIKVSEFLLRRGADPNFIVDKNSTLNYAIKYDRARIARLLIEYGADVNRQDEKGDTPLIYAAGLDRTQLCKILVDRGADPLHTNLKEKRASNYAVYFSESPTFTYLQSMEKFYETHGSVPSMHDGPYIFREEEDQVVLTYYERDQAKNRTRLIEKTIFTESGDTIVEGFGWDTNSYHIQKTYAPPPYNYNTTGNTFVIGDVHGRFKALVNLLINNKVIDPDLKWMFGDGQLVLLGDVFDRGTLVTETLWFIYALQMQARNSGGEVHLLLGNHEIMALTGDDRYLDEKYDYFTQFTQVYYFQLFEKNTVLGQWLRSQNVIARINDNLFLHAGISPEFDAFGYTLEEINARVHNYLYSDYRIEKGSPEDIILGPIGPQWFRGYMKFDSNSIMVSQEFVDTYLKSNGLKRMILGHNEQLTINVSYNGQIISADVAIDGTGKSSQGLLISGDDIFRCLADGTKELLE